MVKHMFVAITLVPMHPCLKQSGRFFRRVLLATWRFLKDATFVTTEDADVTTWLELLILAELRGFRIRDDADDSFVSRKRQQCIEPVRQLLQLLRRAILRLMRFYSHPTDLAIFQPAKHIGTRPRTLGLLQALTGFQGTVYITHLAHRHVTTAILQLRQRISPLIRMNIALGGFCLRVKRVALARGPTWSVARSPPLPIPLPLTINLYLASYPSVP